MTVSLRGARLGEPASVARAHPAWLALREPADADARSEALLRLAQGQLPDGRLVVHDLGSGTGSMGRWAAPRLRGEQHWVQHDRDRDLLDLATTALPLRSADGVGVTSETRQGDITRIAPDDLADAALITSSALVDMMTAEDLDRLVSLCVGARCPVLVTISVVGRVELVPPDALDQAVMAAFNDHQRRTVDGRRLLGPDAAGLLVAAFAAAGLDVHVRDSPWRLGPADTALTADWLQGWVGAAAEQRPELLDVLGDYVLRRSADLAAVELGVTVHHQDVLALPRRSSL